MNLKTLCVRRVMTQDVATLGAHEKLQVADDVMRLGRIRHLPVVDSRGALLGIITQRDLFQTGLLRALGFGWRARREALGLLLVSEAMKTDVATIAPNASISDAAKLMIERQIGYVVVVENQRIVGILTESDFVKLAVQH